MNFSNYFLLVLSIFWNILWIKTASTNADCLSRADDCLRDPFNDAKGPVCGTNNQTYRSICSLLLAQCQDPTISKRSDGECQNTDSKPCLQSLEYVQSRQKPGITGLLIPKCRPDGMYAAVQCRDSGGSDSGSGGGVNRYCWCVTPEGIAVPNTTVRTGRPHCGHHKRNKVDKIGKAKTSRRYSRGGGRKQRQGCKLVDKRTFNVNLIRNFKSEWTREVIVKPEQRTENEIHRIVLDWKFSKLDKNSNDILEFSEYADLKKIVKKNVKPKRCARQFTQTCDINKDDDISRQEWIDCLSRNVVDDSNTQVLSDNSDQAITDENDEDEDTEEVKTIDELRHPRVLQSLPTSEPSFSEEIEEQLVEGDCLYDRKTNEHQKDALYVPECTSDGRYKSTQCYSTFCWCVNPDTGKVIGGTIINGTKPKCDHIPTNVKLIKGCPESRKIEFLKELINFFISRMGSNKLDNGHKKEEKAVIWSFNYFDKNKSRSLEKKEWKIFRSTIEQRKNLRHCGKKLPRYCDGNRDRKISFEEWSDCLGVGRNSTNLKSSTTTSKVYPFDARINPFEKVLKSD